MKSTISRETFKWYLAYLNLCMYYNGELAQNYTSNIFCSFIGINDYLVIFFDKVSQYPLNLYYEGKSMNLKKKWL